MGLGTEPQAESREPRQALLSLELPLLPEGSFHPPALPWPGGTCLPVTSALGRAVDPAVKVQAVQSRDLSQGAGSDGSSQ